MMDGGIGGTGPLNEHALRAGARREGGWTAALTLPAIGFIVLLLYVPLAWMVVASFLGPSGPTLAHYAQLLDADNQRYLGTTLWVSAVVTLFCVVLAYPTCYALLNMPPRLVSLCMLFIVIPFLSSILVRTYAWLVILQRRGIVNTALIDLGLIEEPIQFAHSYTGTVIGMVHVLLPLAVLPLYGALRAIDRGLLRAAASLGAAPIRAFWTVFFPLSVPAIAGGAAMIFVLSLGFYVTPAVLGGGRVVMWASLVESTVNFNPDWGAASALGIALLVVTLGILLAARRLFGTRLTAVGN